MFEQDGNELEGFAHESFEDADGTRIAYRVKGEGDVVIVLPAWSGSAQEFSRQMEELAADHRVYVVEAQEDATTALPAGFTAFTKWIGAERVSVLGAQVEADDGQLRSAGEPANFEVYDEGLAPAFMRKSPRDTYVADEVEEAATAQPAQEYDDEPVQEEELREDDANISRVPVPEPEPEPDELYEESYEGDARSMVGTTFDIISVEINPRTLLARVRIADGAPLYTSEDPEGTQRVLDLLPDLANHVCIGDVAPKFGQVIQDTELAHLLEHASVELMARTELAGDISTGRTRSLAEDERLFEVELDCPDDVLTSAALSSAAWVLDWAYTGGAEPTPDVDGIVSGMRNLISQLSGTTLERLDAQASGSSSVYAQEGAEDESNEQRYEDEAAEPAEPAYDNREYADETSVLDDAAAADETGVVADEAPVDETTAIPVEPEAEDEPADEPEADAAAEETGVVEVPAAAEPEADEKGDEPERPVNPFFAERHRD